MLQAVDVIEYADSTGAEMAHRFPESGLANIKWGAQLIVRESQKAIFFRDGKALGTFGPGRHTLSTANLPLLQDLVKGVTGGKTPFQAEVYFVNLQTYRDVRWGTPKPILFKDVDLGLVMVRAFGTYHVRIADPQVFINTVVGTQPRFTVDDLNTQFRAMILRGFQENIKEMKVSVVDLPEQSSEISAAMKMVVAEDFGKGGLELLDFVVESINLPEEVEKMIAQTGGVIGGDMNRFMQYKTAQAMEGMATNPGGGGGAMQMGAGLGMGMMMPGMIQQAFQGAQAQPQGAPPQAGGPQQPAQAAPVAPQAEAQCPNCKAAVPAGAKFCMSCGNSMAPAVCPQCQNQLPPGAKFCMNCGTKMGG
ncbi:MAG: SPFH domain-containing protein [Armatimonadetes bacterium]|nr:SPFH domain-containing protein [Armatimonadota bacterium]